MTGNTENALYDKLEPFDKVILKDDTSGSHVLIEQGSKHALEVQAAPEYLHRLEVNVEDGILAIRLTGSWLERLADKLTTSLDRPTIVYRLFINELSLLDLSCAAYLSIKELSTETLQLSLCGAQQVDVESLKAGYLSLSHAGAGELRVAGTAFKQYVRLNGAGRYMAQDLETDETIIDISGSAHARVHVNDRMEVTIRGMGQVDYSGRPTVSRQIFGMGRVVAVG